MRKYYLLQSYPDYYPIDIYEHVCHYIAHKTKQKKYYKALYWQPWVTKQWEISGFLVRKFDVQIIRGFNNLDEVLNYFPELILL